MGTIKTILISRTDSIGDVVLTLPVAHLLKAKFPDCKIVFLGKSYTKPVLDCCSSVDDVICWDEIQKQSAQKQLDIFRSLNADCVIHIFPDKEVAYLAKKTGIPVRIGTSHRLFHWFTCTKLPNFTRKNSELHEAQLNFKLLEPLGISVDISLDEIRNCFDFTKVKPLSSELISLIDKDRHNIILHPKSKGSAMEWGNANFSELIKLLPKERFKIFITGTSQEQDLVKDIVSQNPDVTDLTGKLSLPELISFINHCDALIAASTGPLHLAAVLGKKAVGIYPSVRPMHPGRWAPLGRNVSVLLSPTSCDNCKSGKSCNCMSAVKPAEVAAELLQELK